ncbi:uncharacterized protein LOC144061892 isoform X2 [Vanacampus margaritifer]
MQIGVGDLLRYFHLPTHTYTRDVIRASPWLLGINPVLERVREGGTHHFNVESSIFKHIFPRKIAQSALSTSHNYEKRRLLLRPTVHPSDGRRFSLPCYTFLDQELPPLAGWLGYHNLLAGGQKPLGLLLSYWIDRQSERKNIVAIIYILSFFFFAAAFYVIVSNC